MKCLGVSEGQVLKIIQLFKKPYTAVFYFKITESKFINRKMYIYFDKRYNIFGIIISRRPREMAKKKIVIVGAGFAGVSATRLLAKI